MIAYVNAHGMYSAAYVVRIDEDTLHVHFGDGGEDDVGRHDCMLLANQVGVDVIHVNDEVLAPCCGILGAGYMPVTVTHKHANGLIRVQSVKGQSWNLSEEKCHLRIRLVPFGDPRYKAHIHLLTDLMRIDVYRIASVFVANVFPEASVEVVEDSGQLRLTVYTVSASNTAAIVKCKDAIANGIIRQCTHALLDVAALRSGTRLTGTLCVDIANYKMYFTNDTQVRGYVATVRGLPGIVKLGYKVEDRVINVAIVAESASHMRHAVNQLRLQCVHIVVKHENVGMVIGKDGCGINSIHAVTGVKIIVDKNARRGEDMALSFVGTRDVVDAARFMLRIMESRRRPE